MSMYGCVCGSSGVCVCVWESNTLAQNIAPRAPCTNPIVAAVVACVLEHPGHRNDRPQQAAGSAAIPLIQSDEVTIVAPWTLDGRIFNWSLVFPCENL